MQTNNNKTMWHGMGTQAKFVGTGNEEITLSALIPLHVNVTNQFCEHKNKASCNFYKWETSLYLR